jgi:hypothetical protein
MCGEKEEDSSKSSNNVFGDDIVGVGGTAGLSPICLEQVCTAAGNKNCTKNSLVFFVSL